MGSLVSPDKVILVGVVLLGVVIVAINVKLAQKMIGWFTLLTEGSYKNKYIKMTVQALNMIRQFNIIR